MYLETLGQHRVTSLPRGCIEICPPTLLSHSWQKLLITTQIKSSFQVQIHIKVHIYTSICPCYIVYVSSTHMDDSVQYETEWHLPIRTLAEQQKQFSMGLFYFQHQKRNKKSEQFAAKLFRSDDTPTNTNKFPPFSKIFKLQVGLFTLLLQSLCHICFLSESSVLVVTKAQWLKPFCSVQQL